MLYINLLIYVQVCSSSKSVFVKFGMSVPAIWHVWSKFIWFQLDKFLCSELHWDIHFIPITSSVCLLLLEVWCCCYLLMCVYVCRNRDCALKNIDDCCTSLLRLFGNNFCDRWRIKKIGNEVEVFKSTGGELRTAPVRVQNWQGTEPICASENCFGRPGMMLSLFNVIYQQYYWMIFMFNNIMKSFRFICHSFFWKKRLHFFGLEHTRC